MLQIKSQTENLIKSKTRHQHGLFLALRTVAPRHGLQMAQEKAEYTQQSWIFQRNLKYLLQIKLHVYSSGKSNLYLYGTLQRCTGKIHQSFFKSFP